MESLINILHFLYFFFPLATNFLPLVPHVFLIMDISGHAALSEYYNFLVNVEDFPKRISCVIKVYAM